MLFLHEFASLIEINNQKIFIEIYMYMYLYIASNVFVAERFGCFKMSLNVKKTQHITYFTGFFCKNKKLSECFICLTTTDHLQWHFKT